MSKRVLGKITSAEFGIVKEHPFLIGLQLDFDCSDNGCYQLSIKHTENISKDCCWGNASRENAVAKIVDDVNKILSDAKVNYVSELVGKPVEIIIEDCVCTDFRILTEVL